MNYACLPILTTVNLLASTNLSAFVTEMIFDK